jgi:5,10-methylenetetrahydrofolate reductase
MFVSVEQTVDQKLSSDILRKVNQVTITHLNDKSLLQSVDAVKRINDQTGFSKAVPHIAARNIKSEAELINSCTAFLNEGVNTVLIIGGNQKQGLQYSSVYEICSLIDEFKFTKLCGVYPQIESFEQVKKKKYSSFQEGITQFCLKPNLLNQFCKNTRIGIPSKCSVKSLLKFTKLCGINKTIKTSLQNLEGLFFVTPSGFDTLSFIKKINFTRFHIYNFGKLEQTVQDLLEFSN